MLKTTTLNKKASQEEDEDDYENDPWDEGSSKKLAKKDVLDMKPAKNNIPAKLEESEEDDMVALPPPTKKKDEDNGLFVDNDFGDDFSEEEEEKPQKKSGGGHDIFDKQRPSQDVHVTKNKGAEDTEEEGEEDQAKLIDE